MRRHVGWCTDEVDAQVFLSWKRSSTLAGDTKRAVVTEHTAHWNETIVMEALLMADGDSFKSTPLLLELKEDKLVRKGERNDQLIFTR